MGCCVEAAVLDELQASLLCCGLPQLRRLLEVEEEVKVVAESQKEFLVNLISYDTSYELWPDLLKVDLSDHDPLTSQVLHKASMKWSLESLVNYVSDNFINGFAHLLSSPMHRIKIGYVVLCCGWRGGGGRVVVVVIVAVVAVDVGSRA
ncbi:hypothetical protein Tco_1348364 [Tanacetum coccineum]